MKLNQDTLKRPIEHGGLFHKLFFLYAIPLLQKGNKNCLENADLDGLEKEQEMEAVFARFQKLYQKQKENGQSLMWIFISFVFNKWLTYSILTLVADLIKVFFPFAVMLLIDWFNSDSREGGSMYKLIVYAVVLVSCRSLLARHGFRYHNLAVLDLIFIFNGLFFDKLRKVSVKARDKLDLSKISNSVSADIQRISSTLENSRQIIGAPIYTVIYTYMLYFYFGNIAFIGVLSLFIFSLITFLISRRLKVTSEKKFAKADERNNLIKNTVEGIKVVKFNGLENVIYKKIKTVRDEELSHCMKFVFMKSTIMSLTHFLPFLCSFACIIIYMTREGAGKQTVGALFFMIFIFNVMKTSLLNLFYFISEIDETVVAFKRADETLAFPDQDEVDDIKRDDEDMEKGECSIENGTFSYHSQELVDLGIEFEGSDVSKPLEPCLTDINLNIKKGEFVAIIGEIGSGKTSLLKALCKSLYIESGVNKKNGKIGYIPQKAFMLNSTFRDNIVMGTTFNPNQYQRILKSCQLMPDLENLSAGDKTEIGERGINMSGGQKQRINIARTLYADCDIYMIDDSLSALDADIGQNIFKYAFKGLMQGKTRIMVTHALQYLNKVDRIIFMEQGQIKAQGKYSDLMTDCPSFVEFSKKTHINHANQSTISMKHKIANYYAYDITSVTSMVSEPSMHSFKSNRYSNDQGKIIQKEKRFQGHIGLSVYKDYFLKGGILFFLFNAFIIITAVLGKLVADYWVSSWVRDDFSYSNSGYAKIYILIFVGTLALTVLSNFTWAQNMKRNSFLIFDALIRKLLGKQVRYFNITPIGQIMNLSAQDTDAMDLAQPFFVIFLAYGLLTIIFAVVLAMLNNILCFFVFTSFIGVLFYFSKLYVTVANELMRLRQLSLSPILSSLIEAHDGLLILRSLDSFDFLYKKYRKETMNLAVSTYSIYVCNRFVEILLHFSSIAFMGISLMLMVIGKIQNWNFVVKDENTIAVTVSMLLNMPFTFTCLTLTALNVMINMSSIQRLMHNVDDEHMESRSAMFDPPKRWPNSGRIKAVNVSVKYREGLPFVLKNIDFNVKSGEWIGVLGRTGSGKSTLFIALTRLLEIREEDNGYFEIDGYRSSEIPLERLRQAINVIPQDPFLFKGSLRFNIDLKGDMDDESLIEILKKAQIWNSDMFKSNKKESDVSGFSTGDNDFDVQEKLNFVIENGGRNLSAGQRQLICIARAMVNKPRILLIDEATANIDPNTDAIMQKIIKEEFKGSTVMTIAHRLETIMGYDRLFVFDNGCLIEKGTVNKLMMGGTAFKKIVEEYRPGFKDELKGITNC